MEAFFSCFSCGQKNSTTDPKPISIISKKILSTANQDQNQFFQLQFRNLSLMQSFDDEKSKTTTATTFRTTDTALSKFQDDDEYILNKVDEILKKKTLAQKKQIEMLFVKQNLIKNNVIYLVQKQWSEEYTKFLKNSEIKTIRPVDNRSLLDQKGRLRDQIKQKQDYFIINSRIWKFVKIMYGGGPDIARDCYFPVYTMSMKKDYASPCGLVNPLNLCFMISVLQSLLSIQQLNSYFYRRSYVESSNQKKKPLHNQLHKLITQIIDEKSSYQSIKQFASFFQTKFRPSEQHDAQEFFLYMINILQQQMKPQSLIAKTFKDPQSAYYFYMTSNRSIADRVFAGQLSSAVLCKICGQQSIVYVPFIDLCIELNDSTLESCLKKHFQLEKLDDLYDCEICKKKSKAFKKLSLTKTPNYLMIVLKKFTPSGKKIDERIKYPIELDVRKYTYGHCGETRFKLLSVIIHKGTKSTKGHYYCYTRRFEKDWIYCNDDEVQKVLETDVLGRDAYMLLYERIR